VGGDEFLLLAESAEKPEGVGAEAGQREHEQSGEGHGRGRRYAQSRAPLRIGEHQEREHDAGAHLHTDPGH
jgi:hypothetical protein